MERFPANTSPSVFKPYANYNVRRLGSNNDPPRDRKNISYTHEAQAHYINSDPRKRYLEEECGGWDVRAGSHHALGLEELLGREVDGVSKDLRDESGNV